MLWLIHCVQMRSSCLKILPLFKNNLSTCFSGGWRRIWVLCKEAAGDTVLSPKLLRWVRQRWSHDERRWDPHVLVPGKNDLNHVSQQKIPILIKNRPCTSTFIKNKTFFFFNVDFCSVCFLSPLYRFSSLQTRSCFMVVEGAWALVAQSLPQGKLRNDSSSLPSTSDPSLLPSLPLFSFLSPNSQKSNLYPGLFFLFYLYFLKHLMLQIVWVNGCVRAQMTERVSTAGEH